MESSTNSMAHEVLWEARDEVESIHHIYAHPEGLSACMCGEKGMLHRQATTHILDMFVKEFLARGGLL